MTDPCGEILYRLNDRDEIEYVNDAWGAFAAANGGDRLAAADVLGRPLWEFVADATTQQLYRDILARVRGGRAVRFRLRCDAPDRRRLLEMDVSAAGGGEVEFRVRTVSEEQRTRQPLLDPNATRSDEQLRACGWCKKVRVGDAWAEVEDAVARLGLFEQSRLPRLTHGICEDCYGEMVENLFRDGPA